MPNSRWNLIEDFETIIHEDEEKSTESLARVHH